MFVQISSKMCIQCPFTGTVFNLSSSTDKFRNRAVHTLSIHFFNPLWFWILSLLFPLKQVWQRPFVMVMKYNGLLKITLVLVLLQLFATLISLLFWKFDLGFYYLVCSLPAFHFHVTPSLFMVWVFFLLCFLNVQTRSFLFSLYTLILRIITQTRCFMV